MNELMRVHCNDCGTDFEISPVHHLKYNNGGGPNCHNYKKARCSNCGKEIIVDRHVGPNFTVYCDECRSEMNLLSRKKFTNPAPATSYFFTHLFFSIFSTI